MLEYLVQRRYKLAAGALCKCISQIAVVKRDEESPDYMFHFADFRKLLMSFKIKKLYNQMLNYVYNINN